MAVKLIVGFMLICFALILALGAEICGAVKRLKISDDEINDCFKDVRK